jgi:2-aminoethylphosphonate-pyruvate transaminase
MTPQAMKLLNPGPVTLTERVRNALMLPDLCHREPEFAALTQRVMAGLLAVYPESREAYVPVLLTGSGTAAVEAMLGSLIARTGKKTLVLANGVYGERAAAMLTAQGKAFHKVEAPWEAGIDLQAAEAALATFEFGYVVAVHHETTTGRLNDIAGLGKLCVKYRAPLLLDAVSSFAGETLRFADWNLLACAATANKCLHGVPGIAFVVARRDAFSESVSPATSVYLDLYRYKKEQEKGFSPFTQSVHVLYALDEALRELADAGGTSVRHAHYHALSAQVREGLAALGVQTFLADPSVYGSTLVSYRLPAGVGYESLHDALKAKGFIIYAGQGPFSGQMFRIANMGAVDSGDMRRALEVMGSAFAGATA